MNELRNKENKKQRASDILPSHKLGVHWLGLRCTGMSVRAHWWAKHGACHHCWGLSLSSPLLPHASLSNGQASQRQRVWIYSVSQEWRRERIYVAVRIGGTWFTFPSNCSAARVASSEFANRSLQPFCILPTCEKSGQWEKQSNLRILKFDVFVP
jgi:hypothetical protein